MRINSVVWGTYEEKDIHLFCVETEDVKVELLEFGAILKSLKVRTKQGQWIETVLGFSSLKEYTDAKTYFGAICGRFANRISNAEFSLNSRLYSLEANEGRNSLHSGSKGFHCRVFKGEIISNGVRFSLLSPELDQGFPGSMKITVDYTVTSENGLKIEYTTTSTEDSISNLTNHAFFNLQGEGDILEHLLWIDADFYTPVNQELLPTGEIKLVENTVFDFRKTKPVNSFKQDNTMAGGYDHNFVLKKTTSNQLAARLTCPKTALSMEVYTSNPGIQLYSGGGLSGQRVLNQAEVGAFGGLCLETQYFPDSVNISHFTTPLSPAQTSIHYWTEYRFANDS